MWLSKIFEKYTYVMGGGIFYSLTTECFVQNDISALKTVHFKGLFETICSNLNVLITFSMVICEWIVT